MNTAKNLIICTRSPSAMQNPSGGTDPEQEVRDALEEIRKWINDGVIDV